MYSAIYENKAGCETALILQRTGERVMKRTDLQKRERELKRAQKKEERLAKLGDKSEKTVGDYIKELHDLFFYDETRIYNAKESMEILELFEEMKESLEESQWENVVRKAIKKAGVKEREAAFNDLMQLMNS